MKTYALFDDSFFRKKPTWMPAKLYYVVVQRANPRSKEYMLKLLFEKFPDAELIEANQAIENFQDLILLYPDSIGLGWSCRENELLKKSKHIMVLNGRRRFFKLIRSTRVLLMVKRFMEMTFLPEILLSPLIIILGIILSLKDKFLRSL